MIDLIDCNQPSDLASIVTKVQKALHPAGAGFCIIRNKSLAAEELLRVIHEQIAPSFTVSKGRPDHSFYDIVEDRGYSMIDNPVLSTTNQAFPLHTDCSFLDKPADVVTLYCVSNAGIGGETIVANVASILRVLPEEYIRFLLNTPFPFCGIRRPILEKERDAWHIRFSHVELAEGSPPEEYAQIMHLLKPLLDVLNNPAHFTTIKLEPGDCLLVNNRTSLHGRLAFESNSGRVFYRMRQYWG